ncbi:sodium/potassium-transporting ATPase subunit beta-2a isoform X2 [Clupea harengus]|uniref:Sodium/potassium-transporting ATPase subunit beta n=1 Tax=Clupea harengus TaxID=7950 RepID=A0A6P8GPX6_CLUHA|nr:sodium/potassium-transporting ATPase subunit beta-2a isoform X2 [Clupea harengus]
MAKEDDERKPKSAPWTEFFWNPRTHEVMGRTASSWGLIILFYLVFYTFLAGMFVLTMYVMLCTIDEYKPTYQDRLAIPGLMIRPKGELMEIIYNIEDTESWDKYIQKLDNFLAPYNDSVQAQKNDVCTPDSFFYQEDSGEVRNNPKRSCQFNRTMLGSCSGLGSESDVRTYGYGTGQPCIFIKLNRVIGMLPGKGQAPYVSCGPKNQDTDKIGELEYFPTNGSYNFMYYPFYGIRAQVNYSQPLVAVKFTNITYNTDVNVECKIISDTITEYSERDKFAGRVSFRLRINKNI